MTDTAYALGLNLNFVNAYVTHRRLRLNIKYELKIQTFQKPQKSLPILRVIWLD